MLLRLAAAAALLLLPGALAAQATPAPPAAGATRPTLVVLVTVDQLRGDYYDRFDHQLSGGLARLYRHGAVFTDAHHDHANTETAPGHAATLSGRFPRGTGIVMNAAGVGDSQAPLLGGGGPGASPFRFRGTTLVDWLRVDDTATRALSVSRKDRGAILPLGRAKQQAYWYADDGRLTTSTYYADTLPTWVQRFNARGTPASMAGRAWTLLLPDSAYAEPDSVPGESAGENYVFPHRLSDDPAVAVQQFPGFPWADDLVADFALEGVRTLGLGAGPHTDVLAVSFSAMDAIGHRFGPDSREVHDHMLRLDRTIGRFLDSLFVLRDSTRVVIALTADHGVAPLPGMRSRDANQDAQRVDLRPLVTATASALAARGLAGDDFVYQDGGVTVDRAAFARARIPVDSVLDAFAAAARRVPGVLRVDRWTDFTRADTTRDAIARRWLHMFPPDLQPDLAVTLTPFSVWGAATYFQHGAPHDYDTHVPVVFWGAPFRAGRYDRFARVVDIAPTLAAVLGVTPLERLDGVVLKEAIR